jgi:hypothetical protein
VFNNNRSNYAPKAAARLLEIIQRHRKLLVSVPKKAPTVPRQSAFKFG